VLRTIMQSAALAVMLLPASSAFAYNYSAEERKMQRQACEQDALNLCKDDVPDEPKIIACMTKNKSKLSPPCLKVFNKGGRR
jgi:hypothetical protein